MSLPPHPGIFTSVERRYGERNPAPELRLIDGSDPAGVPVSMQLARRTLYDRSADPAARTALWHQIAERGRLDADRSDWPSAVVWMGLPGLSRTASRIVRSFRAERQDVEAELVTCYLEALAETGADTLDPGGHILRSACSRTWTAWRSVRPELAVEDVEYVGGRSPGTGTDEVWQADYEPPVRPSGLPAGLRITVPAHRLEGVRIGALAQAWGLAGTATDPRYSGRGHRVATLSLRRVGRNG
ncbi:hypothetical protein [Streptomyces uncialis]|uniref:hypothetical protein n=1 Tax=Streptomyces uncialis TaxID=1048205 RepID=UPI003865B476|nr:hypothetical protein OG924_28905 [Streptomyces uncialis]